MRILLPLLALLVLFAAPGPSLADSKSTKITWGQMVDACGGNNSSGGGHVGCDAPCSASGKTTCDYDCKGTGNCTKTVVGQVIKGDPNTGIRAPVGAAQSVPGSTDFTAAESVSNGLANAAGPGLLCTQKANLCMHACGPPSHSLKFLDCTNACFSAWMNCKNTVVSARPTLPPPSLSTSGSGMGIVHLPKGAPGKGQN